MHKRIVLKMLKTLLAATVATMTFAIAVCCYIYAGLGSDSVSVFQEGLSVTLHCGLGTASYIYSFSILVLDFLLARKKIGPSTVINAVLIGAFIHLTERIMMPVFTASDSLLYRSLLLGAGILLVCISCVILIRFPGGQNALDAIAWSVSEKLRWPYRIVRIILDASLMLAGWLMGGVVGVGSIIAVFCLGPIIQFMNKTVDKISKKKHLKDT